MTLFYVALVPFAALVTCTITYTWTSMCYTYGLRRTGKAYEPVHIPYAVPWLGSAVDFLIPRPGQFFDRLLSWHPRDSGACSVLLGGNTTHLLFSATAVQSLFKVKSSIANRDGFTKTVITKSFGLSKQDWAKLNRGGNREEEEETTIEYLMRTSHVNGLTQGITTFFKQGLAEEAQRVGEEGCTVDLYPWLRDLMFKASVTTFYGTGILEVYPALLKDFWVYEGGMLDLYFGVPRLLKPASYASQEKCLHGLTKWIVKMDQAMADQQPNPHSPIDEWEPIWGSRISRARQALWRDRQLSNRGRASMELGFLFGVNSNSIPAVGWMLMHIIDPQSPELLSRVRQEINSAIISNDAAGGVRLDVGKLVSLPLLQSIFYETLRLYVDVLVSRQADQDLRLPLDDTIKGKGCRFVLLKKHDTILAPSWPSHHDEEYFNNPPASTFCPERFLTSCSGEDGEGYAFSSGAAGTKMWPWGGGRTMCPGRVFAKQEVMMAVALVILTFDIKPVTTTSYTIPDFKKSYVGSGTIVPGGQLEVRIRPR